MSPSDTLTVIQIILSFDYYYPAIILHLAIWRSSCPRSRSSSSVWLTRLFRSLLINGLCFAYHFALLSFLCFSWLLIGGIGCGSGSFFCSSKERLDSFSGCWEFGWRSLICSFQPWRLISWVLPQYCWSSCSYSWPSLLICSWFSQGKYLWLFLFWQVHRISCLWSFFPGFYCSSWVNLHWHRNDSR